MKNITATLVIFFALLMTVISGSGHTCSLAPNHLGTSNYEMVKNAELIILAEAKSVTPIAKNTGSVDSSHSPKVRFSVLEVVKGSFSNSLIDVFGSIDDYAGRSDSGDFSKVRPGAMRGMCNAYDYKLGAKFLLFLKNYKGNWRASGNAFSRINEEVSSSTSPWTRTVKSYVQISQLGDYEKEKAALKKIISDKDQADEIPGMRIDIENHFNIPSLNKSFDDLKEFFEQSSQKEWRSQKALWAMTKTDAKSAESLFEKLLADGKWDDHAGPISANFASNKRKDMLPALIDLFADSTARINKIKVREALSEKELYSYYAKRRNLQSVPGSILALADEKDSELIFNKLLQIPGQEILGQNIVWRVYSLVTEEHPSLKNDLIKVLEKMADSGDEEAKHQLTYFKN